MMSVFLPLVSHLHQKRSLSLLPLSPLHKVVFANSLTSINGMFLQLLVVLVSLVASLVYVPSAKGQVFSCVPDPCDGIAWYGMVEPVVLPEFPLCPIDVEIYYKTCLNTGETFYTMGKLFFPNDSTACDTVHKWLRSNPSRITSFVEVIMAVYARRLFSSILYPDTSAAGLQCPAGKKSFNTYKSECTKYCFYDDTVAKMIIMQPVFCAEACCKITHTICWDSTTKSIVDTRTVDRLADPLLDCNSLTITLCTPYLTIPRPLAQGGAYNVYLDVNRGYAPSTSCIYSECHEE